MFEGQPQAEIDALMKRDPEFFSFVLCLAEAGASTQRQPA